MNFVEFLKTHINPAAIPGQTIFISSKVLLKQVQPIVEQ